MQTFISSLQSVQDFDRGRQSATQALQVCSDIYSPSLTSIFPQIKWLIANFG